MFPGAHSDACSVTNFGGIFKLHQLLSTVDIADGTEMCSKSPMHEEEPVLDCLSRKALYIWESWEHRPFLAPWGNLPELVVAIPAFLKGGWTE